MNRLAVATHAINDAMLEVGIHEGVVVLVPYREWPRIFGAQSSLEFASITYKTRPGGDGVPIQEFKLNGIVFRRGER